MGLSISTVSLFLQAVAPLIPHAIKLVERTIPGPKKGRQKRAKVIKTIEQYAKTVPALAVQFETISQRVGAMIDGEVAKQKASGEL
jgi:hypothetical protein